MAIQYSGGTYQNVTWTQSTGTKDELIAEINTVLTAAGWTSSGSAYAYTLTSATTTNSSLVCKVVTSDAATNCVGLKFQNSAGTHVQSGSIFLLPAASKTWRIIANKFQFFIFTMSAPTTPREFAAGGVPYIPTFLASGCTEAFWCQGNAISDTDSTVRSCMLTDNFWSVNGRAGQCPNQYWNYNGNAVEASNNNNAFANGEPRFVCMTGANTSNQLALGSTIWQDGSIMSGDPIIAWDDNLVANGNQSIPRAKFQLFDAVLLFEAFPIGQTFYCDPANPTYTFLSLTNNFVGITTALRATLCVRTA